MDVRCHVNHISSTGTWTPLHSAAFHGRHDVAAVLLEPTGADGRGESFALDVTDRHTSMAGVNAHAVQNCAYYDHDNVIVHHTIIYSTM